MSENTSITLTDGIDPDVSRVLVVAAHPDDADFGVAGSVARWTDAGMVVAYCIVTDGDAGAIDHTIARDELANLRRDEQRAAAAVVGVHDVHFLGYPDGALVASHELRRDICRVVRTLRPDRRRLPVAGTELGSHRGVPTRTTSRRAKRPSARSTRTRATRSPTRNSSPKDSNPTGFASCGWPRTPIRTVQ